MRYHYTPKPILSSMYGETYICDHPVYDRCTLFRIGRKGLAVIQQYYQPIGKKTRWDILEKGLADAIYLQPGFKEFFDERAGECVDKLYPTVTVRQVMWALKMKPLRRRRWETVFDRRDI